MKTGKYIPDKDGFYSQQDVFDMSLGALLSEPNELSRLRIVQKFLHEHKGLMSREHFDEIITQWPFLKKKYKFRVRY